MKNINVLATLTMSLGLMGILHADDAPITATIETTLSTAEGNIKQFAFDGKHETFFGSEQKPQAEDHFTLRFDKPVTVKAISAVTGKLDQGLLEVSTDGKEFTEAAKFIAGVAVSEPKKELAAVRIRCTAAQEQPLALREITIESDPPVVVFQYPVEFTIDVTDAPEMQEWTEKVARICEKAYPMINEALPGERFRPATQITFTMKKDYDGVAFAQGNKIVGAVKFFKQHPDDVGAIVHETTHVVQAYRGRGNPSWLVEGVADYVRFFKFEPQKRRKPNARTARYDASYQTTADFLGYVTEKYDTELVVKLNQAMRSGQYKEELFKDLTGKTVQELGEEWKTALSER